MATQDWQDTSQRGLNALQIRERLTVVTIGVFDSGVGGLSILDEALQQLPHHTTSILRIPRMLLTAIGRQSGLRNAAYKSVAIYQNKIAVPSWWLVTLLQRKQLLQSVAH